MKSDAPSVLRKIFFILLSSALVLFFLQSCGGGQGTTYNQPKNYDELDQLVENRHFEVENQWTMPLGGSRIDLIGNTNFIRFKGDSVNLFLPYFGVRHSGGGYGDEGGIKYEGIAEDLKVEKNPDQKKIVLKFGGEQGSENLDFYVTLFSNGNTNTSVTSSQRATISYQGHVSAIPEKEQ
ncbi:MAG: DUF4251 domain-containing protein [Salegentibacter sp.]